MQEKSFGLFCAAGPKEHLAARRNRMEYQAPEGPVIVWGGKSASLMKSEEVIP